MIPYAMMTIEELEYERERLLRILEQSEDESEIESADQQIDEIDFILDDLMNLEQY